MLGTTSPTIIAHQGGWDEFLLIALPVLCIGGLLMVANRRVNQRLRDAEAAQAAEQIAPADATDVIQPES